MHNHLLKATAAAALVAACFFAPAASAQTFLYRVPTSAHVPAPGATPPTQNGSEEAASGQAPAPKEGDDPSTEACWERVSFPPTKVGQSSLSTLVVQSDGIGTLELGEFRYFGPATQDFTVQSNCPALLAEGSSCTVDVTFHPTAAKTREGTLMFDTNIGGGSTCYVSTTAQAIGYDAANGAVSGFEFQAYEDAGVRYAYVYATVSDGEFRPANNLEETVFWRSPDVVVYENMTSVDSSGRFRTRVLIPASVTSVRMYAKLRNNREFEFVFTP
ncbi:hypothetical protein D3C71_21020 [compost metagenome]